MDRGYKLKDRPEFKTKPKPLMYTRDDTVAVAVAGMTKHNYGSVVIVNSKKEVTGICT